MSSQPSVWVTLVVDPLRVLTCQIRPQDIFQNLTTHCSLLLISKGGLFFLSFLFLELGYECRSVASQFSTTEISCMRGCAAISSGIPGSLLSKELRTTYAPESKSLSWSLHVWAVDCQQSMSSWMSKLKRERRHVPSFFPGCVLN